jgi:hypothetical protein
MKNRKSIFIGAILVALVLTTGAFAYGYVGSTATTLNAMIADTEYYTSAVAPDQPNWETLIPAGQFASQALYPVADGDQTALSKFPNNGENWEKVDETTPDDLATYVYNDSKFSHTDLYQMGDLPADIPDDTAITKITVNFRFSGSAGTTGYAEAVMSTNGVVFHGAEQSQFGPAFVNGSYQWTSNPATSKPWTIADVNALQAGVSLRKEQGGVIAVCTQVYLTVSYEYTITQGDLPTGNLFTVTPNPAFTGDMQFRIYLMNTGELLKAYKYLNIELLVEHSLEADKIPHYQVLTMENGVAQFNIQGGSAATYIIEAHGGGYRLTSDNPADWGTGWTITPEFYLEVSQR